jgi:signal transduction histidine kinase
MQGDTQSAFDYVDRLGELGRQALKEMRLLVYELRPAALQEQPLVAALQTRLDAVELRAGVQARLLVEAEPDLPLAVQTELFQIAEEALNDTLKHAAATAVDVLIGGDDHTLRLEIRHNGQGLLSAPDSDANTGSLELVRMRERVQNVGGTFVVETNPGKGTTVRVTLEREKRENGKSDPHPHL